MGYLEKKEILMPKTQDTLYQTDFTSMEEKFKDTEIKIRGMITVTLTTLNELKSASCKLIHYHNRKIQISN